MVDFDQIIFKNKKFSDILEDIYKKNKEKSRQIEALVADLKPLVKNLNDASLVVPLIKEYIEIGVKNDDILVKLAQIVQRSVTKEDGSSPSNEIISEEDIKKIEKEMQEINDKKLAEISKELLGQEDEKKSEPANI